MSSNADRLAKAVLARREELDANQLDVAAAGGPSNTTLTAIENGKISALTSVTARKLDAGLKWEPGSARRVWDGGEPTPLEGGRRDERWLLDRVNEAEISAALRARLLTALVERGA